MWLDLTADGDVFVPDRRFGRSRRLIDGSSPPFACVAPDHALSLFRSSFSLSLSPRPVSSCLVSSPCPSSFARLFSVLALLASSRVPVSPSTSFFLPPPPDSILQSLTVSQSRVRRRHFAPRRSSFVFLPGRL